VSAIQGIFSTYGCYLFFIKYTIIAPPMTRKGLASLQNHILLNHQTIVSFEKSII